MSIDYSIHTEDFNPPSTYEGNKQTKVNTMDTVKPKEPEPYKGK